VFLFLSDYRKFAMIASENGQKGSFLFLSCPIIRMTLKSKNILSILGYEVDDKGNIVYGTNQIAILSLENEFGSGILRVHGSDDQFFYNGDPLIEEKDLLFPAKLTKRYVYFQGKTDQVRVETGEFLENTLKALVVFNNISNKRLAG
jgi:hypothetical protein